MIKCQVSCIYIETLVQELNEEPVQRFGENSFRVYRLPAIKKGEVTGIIGQNGIGKTTILKILAGQLIPNLGDYKNEADYEKVINFFKGKELQNYFTSLKDSSLKVAFKPQNITDIPKAFKGNVKEMLEKADERKKLNEVTKALNLTKILDRDLKDLSGGELQRVAIAATCLKDAEFYAFDEPTSYLDIKERLNSAQLLRELAA